MKLKYLHYLFLFTIIISCPQFGIAQETEKNYRSAAYWITAEASYLYGKGHSITLDQNMRLRNEVLERDQMGDSFIGQHTSRVHTGLDYRFKASDHWFLGFYAKYAFWSDRTTWFFTPYLMHRGALGKLEIDKKIAYDYLMQSAGASQPDLRRWQFFLQLKYPILSRKGLFALVSYNAFLIREAFLDGPSVYENRAIDKTRLRFGVSWDRGPLSFVLYFMRETDYFYSCCQAGKPDRSLNIISPTYGLGFNYLIQSESNKVKQTLIE